MAPNTTLENWLKLWQETPDLEFDTGSNTNILVESFLSLGIEKNAEILFPLCGKANSMITLAKYGYRIAGIEISPIAINRFFSEHHLTAKRDETNECAVYIAEEYPVKIYCEDLFKSLSMRCQGLFDFAALVAILPNDRKKYVDKLKSMLAPRAKGIVAVIDYDGIASRAPFPVSAEEFHGLFSESFTISELERYEAKVHPLHPLAAQKLNGVIYAVELK